MQLGPTVTRSRRLLPALATRLHHTPSSLPLQHKMNFTSASNPSGPDPADSGPAQHAGGTSSDKRIFAPSSIPGSLQAEQYTRGTLSATDLHPTDPLEQFHAWFRAAGAAGVYQPETVCLSTAALPSGSVSSRFVYLKELDDKGFVVYSNFGTSRKAADLAGNDRVALAFWWREVERQVRVEGRGVRMGKEESRAYFETRERGSRIGAWASRQSQVIEDRETLEGWVREEEKRWEGQEGIEVPEFWGGLRVVPEVVEFWQGRKSRLHDRFRYTRTEEGWKMERLSP